MDGYFLNCEKSYDSTNESATILNLLLATISLFIVLCHLTEETQSKILSLCSLLAAGVMVSLAITVVFLYQADDSDDDHEQDSRHSSLTKVLIYLCCFVQLCGILWRLFNDSVDRSMLFCSVASICILGVVAAYPGLTDGKKKRNIYSYLG